MLPTSTAAAPPDWCQAGLLCTTTASTHKAEDHMAVRIRDGHGKAAYRRKRARLKRDVAENGTPCHICLEPIDVTLPATHRLSFTADHMEPLATGGHLVRNGLRPAHFACNARRGTHTDTEIWAAS